jgi:septal ring factor EnvC (AmiA/AmiB activator)
MLMIAGGVLAQAPLPYDDSASAREAMARARADGQQAAERADRLEAEARRITESAERTAREAAAIAARIQQGEAEIAGHEARARLIAAQRSVLRQRLAERQQPVVRLTAALQRLSRRPPVLALFRPGSIRDTMYMRALLETMLPQVERRTAALRAEIERARSLQRRAQQAAQDLRAGEARLQQRRQSLAMVESRQRIAQRQATGRADREAERALALAEQARDLGALASELGAAGQLRAELARLPGPILRPVRPERSEVIADSSAAPPAAGLAEYLLPVAGRLVSGFGSSAPGAAGGRGIAIAARPGAQAVSPAPGRVAFAGPFRGYGQIVIIEHAGGWASLVTGLAELDTRVGQDLVAGSPLGVTGPGRPVVGLELRRDGEPVNPLPFIAAR